MTRIFHSMVAPLSQVDDNGLATPVLLPVNTTFSQDDSISSYYPQKGSGVTTVILASPAPAVVPVITAVEPALSQPITSTILQPVATPTVSTVDPAISNTPKASENTNDAVPGKSVFKDVADIFTSIISNPQKQSAPADNKIADNNAMYLGIGVVAVIVLLFFMKE